MIEYLAAAAAAGQTAAIVAKLAQGAIAVPEAGNLALFLLGITGLIVGRRASRSRTSPDDSELDA